MFSKIKLSFSIIVCATVLLSGCDAKIGEEPPPPVAQEFSGTQCLSSARPVVRQFIEGRAKEADLVSGWNCAADAIEKFKRYVRGTDKDRYTSQELATFLEKNFLSLGAGENVSVKLQVEFMKLKMLFVGGSVDYITLTELDRLVVVLRSFSDITVGLNPFMKVLGMNWSIDQNQDLRTQVDYFESANNQIQIAATTIAALIEKNNQSYELADAGEFLAEMGEFFDGSWAFPGVLRRFMPVIQKVKRALSGGGESTIVPSEWNRFLLLGSRGYIQYLRYYYFIEVIPDATEEYRISYLAESIEDGLSIFEDLLVEKPGQVITADEIFEFTQALATAWPAFKMNSALFKETMNIKKLVFGGSADNFTAADFTRGRQKIEVIQAGVIELLPQINIYLQIWAPELFSVEKARKMFDEADVKLSKVVKSLASLLDSSYDLKGFQNFAAEVNKLYPSEAGTGLMGVVDEYMPLILDVTNTIFSSREGVVAKEQWPLAGHVAARAYLVYLEYFYFSKDKPMESDEGARGLAGLVDRGLKLAKELVEIKKEGFYSRDELVKIVGRLMKMDLIPLKLKYDNLDRLMGLVLNNFLVSPERRIAGYAPNAFNKSAAETARQELSIFFDLQVWINDKSESFGPNQGFRPETLIKNIKNSQRAKIDPPLKVGLGEMLLSVSSPVALTLDGKGRVLISPNLIPIYNRASMTRFNYSRAITRALLRGFVNSKERIRNYSGATSAEIESAFARAHPIAIELGVLTAEDRKFATSRTREANIFTPHSDSSSQVSYTEMVDLVQMIWSGLLLNDELRSQVIRDCFNGRRVSNSARAPISCIRNSYYHSLPRIATSLAEYQRFSRGLTTSEWATYMESIFKAAGYVPRKDKTASLDDISLAPHALQYVEMVYSRFDSDRNMVISTSEAIRAFPAFHGIIKELAASQIKDGSIKEEHLLDLFTYILKNGRPPTTLVEKANFVLRWRGKPSNWNLAAGRMQLAAILSYIAEQASSASMMNQPLRFDFNLDLAE